MCRPAFDALDRDWAALVRSSAGPAALRRWSDTPELLAPDLDALLLRVWAASKPEANRVCAALAERAAADPTAARALLQILRPGLRTLGRRLALGGSFDDVDVELLALAWERICTYRVDRRPTSVTGNILMDVRKRYVRAVTGADAKAVSLDELSPGRSPAAQSAEHEALDGHIPSLRRAHARLLASIDGGAITPTSATVVWRTRVLGTTRPPSPPISALGSAPCSAAANALSASSPRRVRPFEPPVRWSRGADSALDAPSNFDLALPLISGVVADGTLTDLSLAASDHYGRRPWSVLASGTRGQLRAAARMIAAPNDV